MNTNLSIRYDLDSTLLRKEREYFFKRNDSIKDLCIWNEVKRELIRRGYRWIGYDWERN